MRAALAVKMASNKRPAETSQASSLKKAKNSVPIKFLDSTVLKVAFDTGIITQWESDFYKDNLGKDKLSEKQTHFKNLVDAKVRTHAAKDKQVLTDFECKFALDNFGKEESSLSEKQLAIKQTIDAKMKLWQAFEIKALNDWDLQFMVSNMKRTEWSAKQQPIKERIEKQMEVVAPVLEARMLTEWEIEFYVSNAAKDMSALSAKQRPNIERIQRKLNAWKAHQTGVLNQWELDFYKDVVTKETLSEKQQNILKGIEDKLAQPDA